MFSFGTMGHCGCLDSKDAVWGTDDNIDYVKKVNASLAEMAKSFHNLRGPASTPAFVKRSLCGTQCFLIDLRLYRN